MKTFVEEIGRELTGRELAIYDGSAGLSEEERAGYVRHWRRKDKPHLIPLQLPTIDYACPHRGESPTGEKVKCARCDKKKLDVFDCALYGKCVVDDRPVGKDITRVCKWCDELPDNKQRIDKSAQMLPNRTNAAPAVERITQRNLLYHVYPRTDGDWRTPVNRIRGRMGLFNGRKVIAIAHDDTTEHPDLVEDLLRNLGCEFVRVPNKPNLREVATFEPLFSQLAHERDEGSVTLYGHAKGVTRGTNPTTALWAATVAELCLDYWPVVEDLLRRFPIVGPFKKLGRCWGGKSRSDWHFSGSWFWFRNRDLFDRPNWKTIDRFWSGIEPYPSLHFAAHLAATLLAEGGGDLNLYSQELWDNKILPALADFRRAQAAVPKYPFLNVGCGPHYREGWVNTDVIETESTRPDVLLSAGAVMPFADDSFERIYLGHMLEHVPWEHVITFLREVRRVLKPGGVLCAAGPDVGKAIARAIVSGGAEADVRHIWECAESGRTDPNRHPSMDHHWNCRADRVVWLMDQAGFRNVREIPFAPEELREWPVVCYQGAQFAATGTK